MPPRRSQAAMATAMMKDMPLDRHLDGTVGRPEAACDYNLSKHDSDEHNHFKHGSVVYNHSKPGSAEYSHSKHG